ncbi:MAG TPA: ATP-binding cassette domain-containing protein [Candidatus Azoamicus sp. OHIO2]
MIEVNNLFFNREKKNIFEKLSLFIEKEKITAIMGPSGCGKTTLLKLISNQIKHYNGVIKIKGKDIRCFSKNEMYELRKDIGILFQNGALFSDLTVYKNVAFPIEEHTDFSKSLIRDLVLMKLQSVGLRKAWGLMPAQLSIGMAKRVALARAIALDPSIIMYDEPFAGQDPLSMSILIKLINLLNKFSRMTTVIVSHDIHETLEIADYVYIINERKIIAEGTVDEIRSNNDDFVQSFVHMKINYDETNEFLTEGYEKTLLFDK